MAQAGGTSVNKLEGIVRARRAAADTLLTALTLLGPRFSEAALAAKWRGEAVGCKDVLPYGWYQPPPDGISVLIGRPPDFERLHYGSLRDEANWPSEETQYDRSSILYPYLSAIDRSTGMIGDFVGTFYGGEDPEIRSWISSVYRATLQIASFADLGRSVGEVYSYAQEVMEALGGRNNTVSVAGGAVPGADIGHSVPGYGVDSATWLRDDMDREQVCREIAAARTFISAGREDVITDSSAFTVEPQILHEGLPMASFHVIVAFSPTGRHVIDCFSDIFDYFGMTSWI